MITIVVVSPKALERKTLTGYFAQFEYDVLIPGEEISIKEAETFEEGSELMTTLKKDGITVSLVICADKLLDGSGLDFAKKIVVDPDVGTAPLILYVKKITGTLLNEVKEAGINEVIILPFSMENLRASLTRIVDKAVTKEDRARREELGTIFEDSSNVELEERLRDIYRESFNTITDIERLAPWSLLARLSKAKIYCGQNDFKEALPLLKAIVNDDNKNKMAQELLLLCYKRLGKAYEDSNNLKLLVQQNPRSSSLNQRFGEIILNEGNYEDSVSYFKKAINGYKKTIVASRKVKKGGTKDELTTHSELVSTYFNLITAYKKSGKESLVTDMLKEVFQISPQTPAGWLSMFQTYLASGDFAKAKYSLGKALADNRDNQEFILVAAESYIRQGSYAEALILFERLAKLNPSDVLLYNFMGICNRHMGNHDAALNTFKKALSLDPADASIHFNFGCALEDMNRLDEALKSFNETAKLDPSLMVATSAINRIKTKIKMKAKK